MTSTFCLEHSLDAKNQIVRYSLTNSLDGYYHFEHVYDNKFRNRFSRRRKHVYVLCSNKFRNIVSSVLFLDAGRGGTFEEQSYTLNTRCPRSQRFVSVKLKPGIYTRFLKQLKTRCAFRKGLVESGKPWRSTFPEPRSYQFCLEISLLLCLKVSSSYIIWNFETALHQSQV